MLLGTFAYFALRKPGMAYVTVAVAWAVTLIIGVVSVHIEPRFFIPVLIPFIPLAGAGWSALISQLDISLVVAVTCIILLSFPAYSRFQYGPVVERRTAPVDVAEHLSSVNASRIYASDDYPLYGYYTEADVSVIAGPNVGEHYPQVMPDPGYLAVRRDETRAPTVEWADAKPRLRRFYENEEIVVYRYDI